jgi:hypothetical protein
MSRGHLACREGNHDKKRRRTAEGKDEANQHLSMHVYPDSDAPRARRGFQIGLGVRPPLVQWPRLQVFTLLENHVAVLYDFLLLAREADLPRRRRL